MSDSIITGGERAGVTIRTVQRVVSSHFVLRISDLLGPSREAAVSRARAIAMWFCQTRVRASLSEIAFRFNRDRTPARLAIANVKNLVAAGDGAVIHALDSITESLNREEAGAAA